MNWLFVAVGAGIGACLRFLLANLNQTNIMPNWLPLGTLLANILGGFLMGVMLVLLPKLSLSLQTIAKYLAMTGFLGGLTTFSTFNAEVFLLFSQNKIWQAVALILLHLLLSLSALLIGFFMRKNLA